MKKAAFKKPSTETLHSASLFLSFFLLILFINMPYTTFAQAGPTEPTLDDLKELSIEDLMNIEVTSVSKMPEKLTEVASAIQVITQQDIKRSAATSVPEALRLCPNLQVTQINSHHWTISARGFNNIYANKLLVMIDGRTVYSPLFAGVFWDAQNVMLEDVDRIEVISGPGGTLWGANAVNGVINIITKSAKDTQGLFVSGSIGSFLRDQAEIRYGGKIGSDLSYRVYGHHSDRNPSILPDGQDNADKWQLSQGGFAMDWGVSNSDAVTLQGNFYAGKKELSAQYAAIDGQNVMGKWTHTFSDSSNLTIQTYVDRTWRKNLPSITDELFTYDFDLQHRLPFGKSHNIIWGAGYRFMNDKVQNLTQSVGFLPEHRKMELFSSFIQSEISLFPDFFKMTIGTKLEHNSFSGFSIQPNIRLALTPFKQHVLWASVSRAIRAPSRIDVDYRIPAYDVPPPAPSVAGGPNFMPEKVIAYELGYRIQPLTRLSISLATFYNTYDDLFSVEPLPGTQTYQIQNGVKGHSYGAEFSGNYRLTNNWRLRGGYTYFLKELKNKPGNLSSPIALKNLGSDAKHLALLQSIIDLPANFQLDMTGRYIDSLPATQFNKGVKSYFTLDARFAWEFKNMLEFSVAAQGLLKDRHTESAVQIPRGIYGKITWRY